MGSRIWLAATVIAVSLALPGCDNSADNRDQPMPSDTTTSADFQAAMIAAPEEGTCWRVPADTNGEEESDWFDDSPVVSCTKPHTTETVKVLRLTKPTLAQVKEGFDGCWQYVRVYLGVDASSWIPWSFGAFLPTREQIADGASWMRCDVIFPETWPHGRPRTVVDPAEGVADDPPGYLWACLGQPPNKLEQPFVPCDQPHQYEETGTLAFLENLEKYPSAAELASATRQQCSHDVQDKDANVAVTANWAPRSALRDSTELVGSCFIFNKTGQPLAPRP